MSFSKLGCVLRPLQHKIRSNFAANVAMASIIPDHCATKLLGTKFTYNYHGPSPGVSEIDSKQAAEVSSFIRHQLNHYQFQTPTAPPPCPGLEELVCRKFSSVEEFTERVKLLPSNFQALLMELKSKVKGKEFEVVAFRYHGTLTILVRGPGVDGVFVASDGIGWSEEDGKPKKAIFDDEKVFEVNPKVVCVTGGACGFADLIIEAMDGLDLTPNECVNFAKKYMKGYPLIRLIPRLTFDGFLELCRKILRSGFRELLDFIIIFASADEKGTTVSAFYGYESQTLLNNPLPLGITLGMRRHIVEPMLKKCMARGMSVEDSLVLAIAYGYKFSVEDDAIGGRIIIKQVSSSKGVVNIWDGDIEEMLKKYNIQLNDLEFKDLELEDI